MEDVGKETSAPVAKRPKRKWPIVVGVVAVVLVAAGAGFWVWHEQPSFCNAICHEPMDNYVDGYYHDATLMAYAHQQEGAACLDCHEAKIEEQVTEATSWASKSYQVDEAGSLATTGVTADKVFCAKSGCHDWDVVVAATQDWGGDAGVNPHRSHQGEAIDCSNCHVAHGSSYMYCNTCHDYAVPDGWQQPNRGERRAS
ncbi:MAG: cytochrome c3 family protein [Gordonibacter sp.]|uniref:cytochrome c3 family protein n=1 Tax=Gordonibacter sp. TaxID=1968902 RepID=UPI002FC62346